MLPACHRSDGQSVGTPDVCNTPSASGTTPVVYVNTGQNSQAAGFSTKVLIASQNALHLATSVTTTSGDEAGTAHGTIKGKQSWCAGNAVVFIENQPAVTLTSPTSHNAGNCPVGTTVQPSSSNELFTERLGECRVAPSPATGWAHAGEVAIATIARFSTETAGSIGHLLRTQSPRGLVIDLRGCRGGALDAMLRLADRFLPEGTPLLDLEHARGITAFRSRGVRVEHLPLALAVDRRSASAAELFAALLQHHGRAAIFGEASYGKSAALVFVPAGDDVAVRRAGRCLLPDGHDLAGRGVLPDVACPPAEAVARAVAHLFHLTSRAEP